MANKLPFTIEDNTDARSEADEIRVVHPLNDHVSQVWTISFEELVDLQHTITTFIAGERLG